MVKSKKERLSQIANKELFYGCLSGNIGLFSGKIGLSIFLYHYSRFTGNILFADFAGELIDEVCESVHDRVSLSFDNGLSGIGWGLEYLGKNQFIEIDDNSVFEEFNYKILEINPDNVRDCSLATGLGGISTYVHAHISAARPGRSYFPSVFIQSLNRRCSPKTDEVIWDEIIQKASGDELTWQNGIEILRKSI